MSSTTSKPDTGPQFPAESHDEKRPITDSRHQNPLDHTMPTLALSKDVVTSDVESGSVAAKEEEDPSDSSDRPKGARFALLFTCILLGSFFVGYDTSCVATLTPVITDQFHALQDLGWYALAYLLTESATTLIYGQLYSFYSMKMLYMASLAVFVVGSVLSATGPSSSAFIVGRAISGLGSAGLLAGTNIIVAKTTSLKHRSIYAAISGGVECIALALGPFISGAIAHYSTWRVSFYILIPMGVGIFVLVFLGMGDLRRSENAHLSAMDGMKRIDWPGFAVSLPMTLCFILGLQWAGGVYSWSNWRIILLLTLAGVFLVAFLVLEHRAGDRSMVPLKMLRQRTVLLSSVITFCNFAHLALIAYYLPFYFQAVRGASTFGSGIMYLPLASTIAVAAMASGPMTSSIGYPNVPLILGGILMTIGAGLITTFGLDTSTAKWISYQIVYGIGIGIAFQPPYIAVQTVLEDSVVPMGLVMLSFMQQCGGIVILSIAQNVFLGQLSRNVAAKIPGLDPQKVLASGALGLISAVPEELRDQVLEAYNGAIKDVFFIALGLTCLATVCALGIEWRSVKKNAKK